MIKPIAAKYRDVLGLDVGTSSLKLVWLRKGQAAAEVLGAAVKSLPKSDKNIFLNEDVQPAGIIKAAVREIGCTAKKAFVCISGPTCYTKRISVVSMPHEELKEAVKWALKDQIPMDLDRVVIGYQLLGESTNEQGINHTHILTAIAEKRIIYECVAALTQAGLAPAGINLAPFALGIFFNNTSGPSAVLDIGSLKAELTFFNNGLPQFSRLLPGSGSDLTKAMTSALVSDRGRLELTYEEAEALKIDVGIPETENVIIKPGISSTQILSMLRPVLEKLTGEIKRSFDYYKSQLKLPAPDKIYLTGGGSLLKNFDKTLSRNLGLKVEALSSLSGSATLFDIATAAASDEARHVDLVPVELKMQKVRKMERLALRVLVLFSVALLAATYLSMTLQIYSLKRQIEIGRANYQAMQEVAILKGNIDKQGALLARLVRTQPDNAAILKALSMVIPTSVELDNFSRKENSEINIRGSVVSARPEAALANFIKSMQETRVFKNIKILSLQKDASQALMSRFAMSCQIDEAPEQ